MCHCAPLTGVINYMILTREGHDRNVCGPLSRKRPRIQSPLQWSTYMYRMVTCMTTSRDPERSTSWPQCLELIWCYIAGFGYRTRLVSERAHGTQPKYTTTRL